MCMSITCCCIGGVCKLCCWSIPCKSSRATRLFYTFGLFLVTVVAWVLRNWGDVIFPESLQTCTGECFQYMAVYRVSLGFMVYHLIMCLLMIGVTTSRFRGRFHNEFWPIKAILCAGLITAAFYVPDTFFTAFAYVCIVCGVIFLIVQTILILDFAYNWAERFVEYYEESYDPCWRVALVGLTLICYAIVVGATVVYYIFFTTRPNCGLNIFFVSFNIALVLALSIGAILPKVQEANPRSGLLQAAILSAYITYVVGSALASEPNNDSFSCSEPTGTDSFSQALFYIGFAGTFLSICISAFSAGSSDEPMTVPADKDDIDDEKEGTKYPYYQFHLVFTFAAGYFAVLLTNWGIVTGQQGGANTFEVDRGFGSVWAKMGTSWVVALLYIWTLVAPILFPDRNFSYRNNN